MKAIDVEVLRQKLEERLRSWEKAKQPSAQRMGSLHTTQYALGRYDSLQVIDDLLDGLVLPDSAMVTKEQIRKLCHWEWLGESCNNCPEECPFNPKEAKRDV